ncbi:hypothetical protein F5884DRAFT_814423 [Xylogone sp. PMI_703]|nr:hypothetical protein F5884DRAFT_814423 [Xylogone sp. PMI_703]
MDFLKKTLVWFRWRKGDHNPAVLTEKGDSTSNRTFIPPLLLAPPPLSALTPNQPFQNASQAKGPPPPLPPSSHRGPPPPPPSSYTAPSRLAKWCVCYNDGNLCMAPGSNYDIEPLTSDCWVRPKENGKIHVPGCGYAFIWLTVNFIQENKLCRVHQTSGWFPIRKITFALMIANSRSNDDLSIAIRSGFKKEEELCRDVEVEDRIFRDKERNILKDFDAEFQISHKGRHLSTGTLVWYGIEDFEVRQKDGQELHYSFTRNDLVDGSLKVERVDSN